MRRRSGFTLVEVMAAISVGSVLLVLAMGLIHRALNLESNSRDQDRVRRSITRLSHDFRHDVQRSIAVEVDPETALLLTLADDSTVAYSMNEGHVLREQPLEEDVTRRELYDIPVNAVVRFIELESPDRVELAVTHDLKLKGVVPRPLLHAVVEVGRLVRLASPEETQP